MRSLLLTGLALVLGVRVAAGDEPSQADALFEEGQQLKAAGKVAEACQKFEGALALNPNAVGLILNVALCDEDNGKVATAARLYIEARDRASEQKLEEHKKAAVDHLAKVEPRVPHLSITFAEAPGTETKLVVDDRIVPVLASSNVPIDPGTRTVVVTAPGRVPYETKLVIKEAEQRSLEVPKLGYPTKGRVAAGKLLLFGGGALALAGGAVGLYGSHLWHQPFDQGLCKYAADGVPTCDTPEAVRATDHGRTYATVGTFVIAGGVLAAGVGAYLWFFGPKDTERLAVVPTLGGITALGRF